MGSYLDAFSARLESLQEDIDAVGWEYAGNFEQCIGSIAGFLWLCTTVGGIPEKLLLRYVTTVIFDGSGSSHRRSLHRRVEGGRRRRRRGRIYSLAIFPSEEDHGFKVIVRILCGLLVGFGSTQLACVPYSYLARPRQAGRT